MQASIIIPVHNAIEVARSCLESIFNHGSELTFEVVVVDNGSTPEVEKWLVSQEKSHSNLRHLRYEEPLGFARAVILGVQAATGDVLIILNSDTIVTPRWLDDLYSALQDDVSLGALTPSTNHAGEPAQMDFDTVDLTASKALALRARKQKAPYILYLPQRLTFFCVALRREVWTEFGGLDEAYRVGNYEDDDLCLRLRVAGYRIGIAQHVFVYHHNNATFRANKINHAEWSVANATIFAERAMRLADATVAPIRHWQKQSKPDVSIVVLPRQGGSLERTLQSLANQTIRDFEIVLPDSSAGATRLWIAYVSQGDMLYPFHLEALLDAMERSGSEAIFSDGWIAGASRPESHPDAVKLVRKAPTMLAGWMHHASLDCDVLWEQTVPVHWPRLTWQMQDPPLASSSLHSKATPRRSFIERARQLYRAAVPYETRLRVDANIRKLIRRPKSDAVPPLLELAAHLESLSEAGAYVSRITGDDPLPPVIMFNAIAWNSLTQRQHHFARGLARRGHTVFWIEPALAPPRIWWTGKTLQQAAPGIYLIRLPGNGRDIYTMQWTPPVLAAMSAALAQVFSADGLREALALVNYPLWEPIVAHLRERYRCKVAYDCLDDQRALADLYQSPLYQYEERLVAHADLLFTSSVILQQRLAPRPSILLHNANDFELFSSGSATGLSFDRGKPVIGFFGALADWLDMELIHSAALKFPDWLFVFIGPHVFSNHTIEMKWLRIINLPNIVVIPQMDPRLLADHLAGFDVCIMPFLDIEVTRTMNAVKLYEYLAAGKPTISRDLPEVRHLVADSGGEDLIALYSTQEQFFDRLLEAAAENDPGRAARRQSFARQNDWGQRIDVLSQKLIELVSRRSSLPETSR